MIPTPPLYKQNSGPLMDETGRAALFMAVESPLLICPYRRRQMMEEKDINYNPVTVLLQEVLFAMWTFQSWE